MIHRRVQRSELTLIQLQPQCLLGQLNTSSVEQEHSLSRRVAPGKMLVGAMSDVRSATNTDTTVTVRTADIAQHQTALSLTTCC